MEAIPLITLNEAYSDYETKGGIFSNIGNLPWSSIMVGAQMDTLYFDTHSGERFGSRIIIKRVGDDGSLSTADRKTISTLVYARFRTQWSRLWATMDTTYEPLTNYQMEETIEGTESSTRTPDLTKGDTGTVQSTGQDKRTPNITRKGTGTVKDDGTTSGNTQNNLWGFNSSTSIPSDMSDVTGTNENTTTRDLTENETGTDTTDKTNTDTYNRSYTETGTDTTAGMSSRKLTRKGNIGTNTFQNLLQQERNLWMYDFFEQIFKDVDSVLTIPIY